MNVTQAMARLYSVALFAPGFEGATATNILLRAERILAGVTPSELAERRALAAELNGLRVNLQQRQDLLQRVHDTLAAKNIGKPRVPNGG